VKFQRASFSHFGLLLAKDDEELVAEGFATGLASVGGRYFVRPDLQGRGASVKRVFLVGLLLPMAVSGMGCSLAPKSFRDMIHPAPIVRARAVGLDDNQPEWVAVPALIERLNDSSDVVRMTASDGLKERTKRDFGFVAWAPADERAKAVARWKAWWEERRVQAGYPKTDDLRKVAARPARRRRIGDADDQGGTNPSWPATSPTAATAQPPSASPTPSG
jgi:hypothetical protein